jgi:hypothetical protein
MASLTAKQPAARGAGPELELEALVKDELREPDFHAEVKALLGEAAISCYLLSASLATRQNARAKTSTTRKRAAQDSPMIAQSIIGRRP